MAKKKPSAAEQMATKIRQATAKIIREGMIPRYGVGYRVADIVGKVRVELGIKNLPTRDWFKSITKWLDDKIAKFNNKYFNPTAKGHSEIMSGKAA